MSLRYKFLLFLRSKERQRIVERVFQPCKDLTTRNETSAQLEVRVQPRAKRDALEAVEGQSLKAYVTAPPEGGKANEAVVALLAKALGLAKGRVTIVRGHRGRNKLVRIGGLTEEDIFLRLDNVVKVPSPRSRRDGASGDPAH